MCKDKLKQIKAYLLNTNDIYTCSRDKRLNRKIQELIDKHGLTSFKNNKLLKYSIVSRFNKRKILKVVLGTGIFLTIILYPNNSLAISSGNLFKETLDSLGSDLLDAVNTGAVKGVLIITVLRLTAEYTRGGSKYKFVDVLKQCAIVLFILIALPMLPGIVNIIVNKYLPY